MNSRDFTSRGQSSQPLSPASSLPDVDCVVVNRDGGASLFSALRLGPVADGTSTSRSSSSTTRRGRRSASGSPREAPNVADRLFLEEPGFRGRGQRGDREDARAVRAARQQRRGPRAGLRGAPRGAAGAGRSSRGGAGARSGFLRGSGRYRRARVERPGRSGAAPGGRRGLGGTARRVRGDGRVRDGRSLPARRADPGRSARRGLRRPLLRLLRGRGPLPAPGARGLALRVRARRGRPPRGLADRAADAVPARGVDGPQPLAHALRATSRPGCWRGACRLSCARTSRTRGVSAWPARCCRSSSGRGSRSSRSGTDGRPASSRAGRASRPPRPDRREVIREITAILVSWRDGPETIAAVGSLADARARVGASGPAVSLVVVDNSGGALAGESIVARWPDATVLVNRKNRGFGPAVNQARGRGVRGRPPDPEPGHPRRRGALLRDRARFRFPRGVLAVAPRLVDVSETPAVLSRTLAPPGSEDQFTFQLRRLPRLRDDARELLLSTTSRPNNRSPPAFPLRGAGPGRAARGRAARGGGARRPDRRVPGHRRVRRDARPGVVRGRRSLRAAARARRHPLLAGGAFPPPRGHCRRRARLRPLSPHRTTATRSATAGAATAPAARLGYRALLAAGMLLRLAALPLRPRPPRPRRISARAYLGTLSLALGLAR